MPVMEFLSGVVGQLRVINVKDFGATGNGIIDDTSAIAAALASATAGDVVFIPRGIYLLSSPLNIPTGVSVIGSGYAGTLLTVAPASFGNYSFAYVLQGVAGTATDVRIMDLHIDGQKRNGTNPANQCGGVAVGTNWILERVHEDDMNYFGFWINGANDFRLTDCQSSRGGNNDHIGGGTSTGVVTRHRWNPNLAGNAFDHVASTGIRLEHCHQLAASAGNGNVYFEGCSDSGVEGTQFESGSVTIKSNAGYAPSTYLEPLRCFARGNKLKGAGITLAYDNALGAVAVVKGGLNSIANNQIDTPPLSGVHVQGGTGGTVASFGYDEVIGNQVYRANANNVDTWNDGLNNVYPSAVSLDACQPVNVVGNVGIDDRATAQQRWLVDSTGGGPHNLRDNAGKGFVYEPYGQHSGAAIRSSGTYTPASPIGIRTPPAFPANGVAATNTSGYDVTAFIANGTGAITQIAVGGNNTNMQIPASGWAAIRIPAGQTITFTYAAGAPAWTWFGE